MSDELYVNKKGFKCVRSQLAKTDGRDPQEHHNAMKQNEGNQAAQATEVAKLKVWAAEYQ